MARQALLACALVLLAGCGQKGALHLPGESDRAVITPVVTTDSAATPAPAAGETEEDESDRPQQ